MQFGLLYFSSGEETPLQNKYRLVIDGARFADQHGFLAVWIPERHFTQVGCLYPNPAVVQAAVARETTRIQLRAGSVVLPLHHPIRVAEEWAVVDNLSNGRVALSFASGWHPDDFVIAPEKYKDRSEEMYRGIEIVKTLWQGGSIKAKGGDGKEVEIKVYPTPIQKDVPIWLTAAGNPKTFARAGEMGANLLTHLFNQGIDETRDKIAIYREARARAGHDPRTGQVAVMMHTFLGPDLDVVREQVRGPFGNYLKSSGDLLKAIAYSQGQDLDFNKLSQKDRDYLINFVFERLFSSRVLFGTPQSCLPLIEQLQAIGVDEIACQMDFGMDTDLILASLPYLNELRESSKGDVSRLRLGAKPQATNTSAVEEIRSRCSDELTSAELRRQGIERLWRGSGEVLAELHLPQTLRAEANVSRMQPALLDLCFQMMRAMARGEEGESLYVPAGMRGVRTHGRPGRQIWGHVVLRDGAAADVLEGDVRLLDESGELVVEALGLRLKRAPGAGGVSPLSLAWNKYADWFYEVQWQSKAIREGDKARAVDGHWLILGEGQGLAWKLAALLESRGGSCTVLDARGDAIDQALASDHPIKGVIHLGSLDAPAAKETNAATLETAAEAGANSVVRVLHALARSGRSESPRLWIATRGATPTQPSPKVGGGQGRGEPLPGIAQSPVWGLGRMIPVELAQFWGGLVDLDPAASVEDAARQLLDTLNDAEREDQVAYRRGQRYVARLVRKRQAPAKAKPFKVHSDGTYLIMGGLGGIGLRLARWLVSEGARHLVLLGRTPLPPRESWSAIDKGHPQAEAIVTITELEAKGTRIRVVATDVADEAQMAGVLEMLRREDGTPIRGVMHAAGMGLDRMLVDMDSAVLSQVFRAKVSGSWVLHRLLHDEPLDFFVLFSSANSLLATAGQGSYAAANAFLDALAHHRRAEGKPALCVNWGPWGEVGFGATAQGVRQHALLALQGITRLTPKQGIEVLKLMLQHGVTQVGVIPIDWPKLLQAHAAIVDWPLLAELLPREQKAVCANGLPAPAGVPKQSLGTRKTRSAPVAPRNELEKTLLHMWQEVLKSDAISIFDNFFELGGQSIQGAVLVNKLQDKLGEVVHIASLFDAPTIADLAVYLQDHYPHGVARLLGESGMASSGAEIEGDKVNDRPELIDDEKISRFERILKASMAKWQRPVPVERKNPPAIFILSPPRSGSTLLRVMLAGHPGLFAPPELELLSFATLEDRKAAMSGRNSYRLQGTIRALMEVRGCDAEQAARIMAKYENEQGSTSQFYRMLQEAIGRRRLVDKTPSYALSREVLERAEEYFEDVFYIHLLRHPYGMMLSFEDAHLEALFHGMDHSFSPRQLAEIVWTLSQRNILQFLDNVPAHRQCRVRYEDLVERPEPVMRELCRNLGLEFGASMVRPYEDKQKRMTDGIQMFGDVKFHTHKGIDPKMAHRWAERYRDDFLGAVTWRMAESLGYTRNGRPAAKDDWSIATTAGKSEALEQLDQASDAEVDALLTTLLSQEKSK